LGWRRRELRERKQGTCSRARWACRWSRQSRRERERESDHRQRKLQSNWMVVLSTYIFVVGTKGCAQCSKATHKYVDKPTKGAHRATTSGCFGGCGLPLCLVVLQQLCCLRTSFARFQLESHAFDRQITTAAGIIRLRISLRIFQSSMRPAETARGEAKFSAAALPGGACSCRVRWLASVSSAHPAPLRTMLPVLSLLLLLLLAAQPTAATGGPTMAKGWQQPHAFGDRPGLP
jgi:hypothetical protein